MSVENRGNGQMPANLAPISDMPDIGDFGDRRKSQSLHRVHLAIFADRGYRHIKSRSVSPDLILMTSGVE